jgi:dTDP-4-amino-4,6-dideoxygalactose transaminase
MNARIFLSPPHVLGRERELLLDAFDSNWLAPLGPHVNAFEGDLERMTGGRPVAALSSGTAAIHLSLLISGVGPGDLVLCSSLTFAATANAVRYCGATPVFVDSDDTSWNMDPDLLNEALRTLASEGRPAKAVIAVDLYGQLCDYDRIASVCEEYSATLIEDAAESLGASYQGRPAGSFGRFAALSFNGNKIITTSGGGALIGGSDDVLRARFLATQARLPAPHYEHEEVGYNYRMSNILAAFGRGQLETLAVRVAKRRTVFDRYRHALAKIEGIQFSPELPKSQSNRWLTCVTIDPNLAGADRETVRLRLEDENVEARPLWKPMHLQPMYRGCRVFGGRVSERLFENGLCLPSGSSLSESDQDRVIARIIDTLRSGR